MTEDETVGWHHQLNGHKFEQTLKDVEGQRVCTSFHTPRPNLPVSPSVSRLPTFTFQSPKMI